MSKQDPNEKLLHALGDIGGDLIDRAEHAAFRGSRWRQWGALAACLAVVVCAGLISMPMLFGGKSEAPSSEQAVSAPTAAADEKSQMKEETVMEEAPAETEPVTEESAAEAPEEGFGTTDSDTGKTYAVTQYNKSVAIPREKELCGIKITKEIIETVSDLYLTYKAAVLSFNRINAECHLVSVKIEYVRRCALDKIRFNNTRDLVVSGLNVFSFIFDCIVGRHRSCGRSSIGRFHNLQLHILRHGYAAKERG